MRYSRFDAPSRRRPLPISIGVVACLFIGIFLYRAHFAHQLTAVDASSDANVTVTVPSGATAGDVGDLLEDKELIRSSRVFRSYAKKHDLASKLKAGTYALKASQDVPSILEALTGGSKTQIVITIPEGFTVKDIDALLVEKELTQPGDVQECARTCAFDGIDFLPSGIGLAKRGGRVEGYLFPDTYFVDPSAFAVEPFLKRLLTTFEQKIIDDHKADFEASDRSLAEMVTAGMEWQGQPGTFLLDPETALDDDGEPVAWADCVL